MSELILKEIGIDTALNAKDMYEKIADFEKFIGQQSDAKFGDDVAPLKHVFCNGLYIREITMAKGMFIVSKIHKTTHPYFVLKGDVSVITEEGLVRIKAPYSGITKAGTQRILYTHEDTVWTTIHKTKLKDLAKIEKKIIAKDYKSLPRSVRKLKGI